MLQLVNRLCVTSTEGHTNPPVKRNTPQGRSVSELHSNCAVPFIPCDYHSACIKRLEAGHLISGGGGEVEENMEINKLSPILLKINKLFST